MNWVQLSQKYTAIQVGDNWFENQVISGLKYVYDYNLANIGKMAMNQCWYSCPRGF